MIGWDWQEISVLFGLEVDPDEINFTKLAIQTKEKLSQLQHDSKKHTQDTKEKVIFIRKFLDEIIINQDADWGNDAVILWRTLRDVEKDEIFIKLFKELLETFYV